MDQLWEIACVYPSPNNDNNNNNNNNNNNKTTRSA